MLCGNNRVSSLGWKEKKARRREARERERACVVVLPVRAATVTLQVSSCTVVSLSPLQSDGR